MEFKYALLNNNRVENIIIMDSIDDESVAKFCNEMNYDEFILIQDREDIIMYSLRNGDTFIPADYDYLKSIGVSMFDNAEYEEYIAAKQ